SLDMPAALRLKDPVKVGQLLRRRLRELKRTPRELAEAVQVTEDYMADLVSGRRRLPAPGRSDLYAPMTKFLRLHRNDLPTCARASPRGTSTWTRTRCGSCCASDRTCPEIQAAPPWWTAQFVLLFALRLRASRRSAPPGPFGPARRRTRPARPQPVT